MNSVIGDVIATRLFADHSYYFCSLIIPSKKPWKHQLKPDPKPVAGFANKKMSSLYNWGIQTPRVAYLRTKKREIEVNCPVKNGDGWSHWHRSNLVLRIKLPTKTLWWACTKDTIPQKRDKHFENEVCHYDKWEMDEWKILKTAAH